MSLIGFKIAYRRFAFRPGYRKLLEPCKWRFTEIYAFGLLFVITTCLQVDRMLLRKAVLRRRFAVTFARSACFGGHFAVTCARVIFSGLVFF